MAKSGSSAEDAKTIFCVPMASVIHAFIYKLDAFDRLKLQVPATGKAFFAMLDAIKKDGTYTGLDMGTKDPWEATMGYQNIRANY